MITQIFLDSLSNFIAGILDLIPSLPSEVSALMGDLTGGAEDLGEIVAKTGPVIPWDVIQGCFTIWVGLLAFWVVMLGVRVIAWLAGR